MASCTATSTRAGATPAVAAAPPDVVDAVAPAPASLDAVRQDDTGTTVTRHHGLKGIDINMVDLSDLVPTLAAVGAFAEGTTDVHGVGFIRHKESDRLTDLCFELRRAGIQAHNRWLADFVAGGAQG